MRKIETTSTDSRDKPQNDVEIIDSGAEVISEPYGVAKEDANN